MIKHYIEVRGPSPRGRYAIRHYERKWAGGPYPNTPLQIVDGVWARAFWKAMSRANRLARSLVASGLGRDEVFAAGPIAWDSPMRCPSCIAWTPFDIKHSDALCRAVLLFDIRIRLIERQRALAAAAGEEMQPGRFGWGIARNVVTSRDR